MSDNVDMLQYFSNFNGMISQLLKFDVKFSDEEKVVLIMETLPSSYDHLITTLTYGKDKLEYEVIAESLVLFEKQNKARGADSQALITENRGINQNKGGRNRNNKSRGKLKFKNRNNDGCYHCRKQGHIKKNLRF